MAGLNLIDRDIVTVNIDELLAGQTSEFELQQA
jgi:hypothetical protein